MVSHSQLTAVEFTPPSVRFIGIGDDSKVIRGFCFSIQLERSLGSLDVLITDDDNPLLLSKRVLRKMMIKVDHENDRLTLSNLQEVLTLVRGPNDHYLLQLFNFTDDVL